MVAELNFLWDFDRQLSNLWTGFNVAPLSLIIRVSGAYLVAQLVKNPPAMQETWVRSLVLGRSPGEGKGYTLQYSSLENSMDCIVHGVAKSRIRLSDFHFHFHEHQPLTYEL